MCGMWNEDEQLMEELSINRVDKAGFERVAENYKSDYAEYLSGIDGDIGFMAEKIVIKKPLGMRIRGKIRRIMEKLEKTFGDADD